ncbi:hypothetical protein SAMN05444421_103171 [Celeribacter marinus]|nr:hypothetical protein SAMN05444421_103171 [Celeribacter marinus]
MTRTSLPQPIVAADIGLRFLTQRERGRRRYVGLISWLSIYQPMKQVQHMGLGRHAGFQRHFHSAEQGLFVMLQNQGQDSTISRSPPGLRSIRL